MNTFENLEFGLDTFGDVPTGHSGELLTQAQAIRATVQEAIVADQAGVDVIAVGEHHRPEYAISSPETVLAGIATGTEKIRLGSGVTVLSSDDPVRVYQRFATVDALSNGRAEVMLGRGSFTESFPLFGHDMEDYELLFDEKIDLFHKLLDEKPVTWQGTKRAPLNDMDVFPKTESGRLSTWVGVGGSPQSVIRTAHYGFRMMLAVIGGSPERFAPYIDLYRRVNDQFGHPTLPVGLHSPGFVADTDELARELMFDAYKEQRDRIGASRGWSPMGRDEFEHEASEGSLYIGSPETVARKIAKTVKSLDIGRFDLIYSGGPVDAGARLHAVELYGDKVIPMVREMLADQ
ncbi:LLM class flavin-dependent oxidoreductase [Glutamicibacter ardleyensis]|uniref:LLM class flavin-dependent oxidoreductase n=1 Tax=Glutamicibacter ardleyensis TaxID=225894 RepID=UPI003FD13954